MGLIFCKCCCRSINSVGVLPERYLKVLLLGLTGSGKTDVGYAISRKIRKIHEPTNGVQYYEMELPDAHKLSITEVGGSEEICKIWYHYYVKTMGIIYCFDMSANYIELKAAFNLLRNTLTHPYMRGKPVLLVGTKANCIDEGVQLYDIENTFNLDTLAKYALSSIRLCYFAGQIHGGDMQDKEIGSQTKQNQYQNQYSLSSGVKWLVSYLLQNFELIKKRIAYDENTKAWQDREVKVLPNGHCQTRRRHKDLTRKKILLRRPRTAPASVFSITPVINELPNANINHI